MFCFTADDTSRRSSTEQSDPPLSMLAYRGCCGNQKIEGKNIEGRDRRKKKGETNDEGEMAGHMKVIRIYEGSTSREGRRDGGRKEGKDKG